MYKWRKATETVRINRPIIVSVFVVLVYTYNILDWIERHLPKNLL
jgi:hypothetical protein